MRIDDDGVECKIPSIAVEEDDDESYKNESDKKHDARSSKIGSSSSSAAAERETFTLPTLVVPYKMRLTHAITYDSAQSRTLRGVVRLTQTSSTRMTLRRLIVGLGRAPNGIDVEVE